MKLFLASLLASLLLLAVSQAATQKETLIIIDKTNNINTFKQAHLELIKLIEDLGHKLSVRSADDATLKLSKYGQFLYDNLIILAPQIETFRGSLGIKDIQEFIDSGNNVLIAGNHKPGSVVSELANEVGFDIKETSVKRDYSNTKLQDLYYIVGDLSKYPSTSFSYSGTQLRMVKSTLTFDILSNNAPVDDIRVSSSSSSSSDAVTNVLIGAMQARNNARVIVSGSADFFGDAAFKAPKSANKHLTAELLRWLLKEKSLLRYSGVDHRRIGEATNLNGYTIMDDIQYNIKIELYENGKWGPYLADDIQLEFVRIDPFVRQTMKSQPDGTYIAQFKVPDVYGVYKFQVDYQKPGLTHLFSSTQVSVRPLRHNQYERFIYSAYPYYFSAFLMMVYLYLFSFVYLYQQKEKSSNK